MGMDVPEQAAVDIAGLIANLRVAVERVRSLGPPHRLAGDPDKMRLAAAGWHGMGRALMTTAGHLDIRVGAVARSSWRDDGGEAFQGAWRRLRSEIEDRAAGHEQTARSLEDAAGRAERLNADVKRTADEIERLARTAEGLARQALELAVLPTSCGAAPSCSVSWTRRCSRCGASRRA
jgi:uncharacterized protein YukE